MATVIGNLMAAVEFIKNFFNYIINFFSNLGKTTEAPSEAE